jgi:GNAT superfamily N-acetyltransferase
MAVLGALVIAWSSILVRLADVSPSTAAILRCAYPQPQLGPQAWREDRRQGPPPGRGRQLAAAAGTAPGPQGIRERDAASEVGNLDFRRDRIRRRLTVTAIADGGYGPVAVGSHIPVGDVTEIVGVATLPAVRRQGLGGAVTSALVDDALEHGAEVVFLSAGSDDIARVYHRLGFRRIGTACIAG